jgi:Holliday junction resolvasome RuvABC ATP-dependent DNA helicase subunit
MLNPNREGRNTYIYDEYELTFDFRLHTFIFATSEPQKLLDTLKDRLQPIDLEEYTPDQMERIIQLGAKDVTFKDGVLSEMATVLRGNARQAQNMAEIILTGLKGGHTFGRKEWENLKFSLDIYPLGLNPTEIQVLKILADRPQGTSLTNLAARTTLTKDALQKDYEMYLQKHGLMQITTAGREITAKGLEYLRSLLNQPQFRSKRVIS